MTQGRRVGKREAGLRFVIVLVLILALRYKPAVADASKPQRSLRLLHRRELPVPTWRGWLVLLGLLTLLSTIGCRTIQPFLAVNDPVPGGPLVIEGWLADYALQAAVNEFQRRTYDGLYTTGVPLEKGAPLSEYRTYAELGAAVIAALGVATNAVHAVPAPDVRRDRTYTSAVALREWFAGQGRGVKQLTVVSVGAHARRTRLLYEFAFGPEVRIGVICVPDREYEPDRWWASSAGVRDVVDETVAYLYARFVFDPPAD
ncbi:MAG TPA: cytosine deaminase [Verrucomicrobiales bacterium]|nr:cytosine deaminase [Verrucomicrobiales bacterium]